MEIVVPELGESIVEATIARWLKKEGEPVSVGEPVVELETDKVDLEVGAKEDGVLARILRQEGEDVQVGEALGMIEPRQPGAQPKEASQAQPEAAPAQEEPQPPGELQPEPAPNPRETRATPVARRMAEDQGVDLNKVPASGPGERVTKEDIQGYLGKRETAPPTSSPPKSGDGQTVASPPVQPPKPVPPAPRALQAPAGEPPTRENLEERQRLSRRRRTIAERLVEAQHNAAMLTTFNDVDMSAVIDIRKRRQETFQKRHGIKLGFMSFFVKATIGALKEFPRVNAEIQGEEVVIKHYYDIGMAIGAEEGLVVPVLRDADRMSFAQIEGAILALVEKARQGTLSLEDLRGGTFTITNGGVYGSLLSTPILNPPQVGILGLHRIEERPVAVDGQVAIRPMMYLALSYDHRIVDGREAVQFLVQIKELIQDPERLLLEG